MMKKHIISWMLTLMVGSMTAISHAQLTVATEDYDTYPLFQALGVNGYWGDGSNVTAMVNTNGANQVGQWSGYATSDGWNILGLNQPLTMPSNRVSSVLADYTVTFDCAQLEGNTAWNGLEMQAFDGSGRRWSLSSNNRPSPVVGAGFTNYVINLGTYTFLQSGFDPKTLSSLEFNWFGGWEGATNPVLQVLQVDNIVVTVDPTPFVKVSTAPIGVHVGGDQTVSAKYTDNGSVMESMTLYLDNVIVATTNNLDIDGLATNSVSYDATGLAVGVHTAKVVVADFGSTVSLTNQWTFQIVADDPTIIVGIEDFESYALGTWDSATYPDPNPAFHDGGTAATIVDEDGTNQALLVNGNLQNFWAAGIIFDLDMSGLNKSANRDDYTLEFDIVATNVFEDWGPMGFEVWAIDESGTYGSFYQLGDVDGTGLATLKSHSPYHFSFSLGAVDSTPWNRDFPLIPTLDTWRMTFAANNNNQTNDRPVTFTIDNVIVKYTKPVFLNPSYGPIGITTNDPTVWATVIDGTSEVDTMDLYIDGGLVASTNVAGGSTTNTVYYDAIGIAGGSHGASVVYADNGTNVWTNTWSFIVPLEPLPPATVADELYNVNMAGCVNDGVTIIPSGVLLVAPSSGGSNLWYNAYGPDAPWSNPGLVNVPDANHTSTKTVGFQTGGSNWNAPPQSWAGYYADFLALSNTIWGTTQGDSDSGWAQYTGLDTNASYDVYIYWTWNRNDDAKTYNVTEGTCNLPTLTMDTERTTVLTNYGGSATNYLEGTNYVVFTAVTPNASGTIRIEPNYSCAWQLVKRGTGGPVGPTIDPDIMSMSVSGGMAYLMWNSETGVTYSVMSKTGLTDPSWTEVTTVPGAGATTSASVPAGLSQEFYMIEGN